MKNLFYIFILLFLSNTLPAQITQLPNNSFDEWDETNVLPVGWSTYERIFNSNFGLAVRDTNDYLIGSASLKLQSTSIQGQIISGIAILGESATINSQGQIINDGVPYTERPDTIEILYKYNSSILDTGLIQVGLVKNTTVVLNFPFVITDTSSQWMVLTYPLAEFYIDTFTKPNLAVSYLFSDPAGEATLSTVLNVDGIFFYSKGKASTFTNPNVPQIAAAVYPNPTADELNINSEVSLENYGIVLYDTNGKVLIRRKGEKNTKLNIADLIPGNYNLLILNSKNEPVFRSRITKI